MRTNDADPDFLHALETGRFEVGHYARRDEEGFDIVIDGAVGYSLRLIPSGKVLGRYSSAHEAWPVIVAQIERGMPAKCLVLDWHRADGSRGKVGSGRVLASIARSGIGARNRVRAAS